MQTADKAVRLVIEVEELDKGESVNSSTESLTYLNVTAVDKKGRIVPTYDEPLTVTVDGVATLYALDNHDHYTDELFHGVNTKKMHEGRMQIILRNTQKPGKVTVKAETPTMSGKLRVTNLPAF